MHNVWSNTNTFQTSYSQLHDSNQHQEVNASRLNDPNRFRTLGDSLLRTNKENNFNDYLTCKGISFSDPRKKPNPFSLLDTTQSGFSKNNLNNDGLTYYNGRVVDKKDMRLTEYRNKFRPFK